MNNIITNWKNIIEESERLGMPADKKRGILREYLQTIILSEIYSQKASSKLSFIGGTSLRLIRNLNRFSEDLDFDNLGVTNDEIERLFLNSSKSLTSMNIENEFSMKIVKDGMGHGSIKFLNILKDLDISTDPREKVRIDFDFTTPSKPRKIENVVYARYGYVTNVLTNTLPTLAMQKIDALINREDPKARDLYDVFWLLSKNIVPDLKSSQDEYTNLIDLAIALRDRYTRLEKDLDKMIKSLEPFLFDSGTSINLRFFPKLVEQKLA